ncbi:MAG TPA: sigma-54 dependent transcriptional regulator [Polyangiales bacterium]|nr:sigma-54 dependent transcriptional regulator [Polyangiales bacterium]
MNDVARRAARVLIVDDDAGFRFAMGKALGRRGFVISEAESGEAALTALAVPDPADIALLDLRMRGIDGLTVLQRHRSEKTRFIVLTGHGSVAAAVEAMKLGAFSFLEKPVDAELLAPLIEQALADRASTSDRKQDGFAPPIVGDSPAMDEVRRFVARAAQSDETVAVYGETGTGKEVVARHLHVAGKRAGGPFVAVNAACVQRELFESELFGHRKGAFTGATGNRDGLFVEANGGTLFIDEVAELPLDCQAKLLRALETRRIRPLGGSRELEVDVRIVAATNRDLWNEVRSGAFREDLFFRLQVLPIVLPPLRERRQDVPQLARHLLERIGSGDRRLDADAETALLGYAYPGNVRELLNVLRRAVLFADGPDIDGPLIRRMLAASVFGHAEAAPAAVRSPSPPPAAPAADGGSAESLASRERAHIVDTLERMNGNVTRAASALGIDRRTLQRKLRGLGITR